MNHIFRGKDGNFHMETRGLWKRDFRRRGEPLKEKEKKCWTCGSMPWRVEGKECKECGLKFEEESIEIDRGIKSSMGEFEDNF